MAPVVGDGLGDAAFVGEEGLTAAVGGDGALGAGVV